MKLGELADTCNELVKAFGRDINVDCNDTNGTYTDVLGLSYQAWTDSDGKRHETIAIMHKDYNNSNSLIEK